MADTTVPTPSDPSMAAAVTALQALVGLNGQIITAQQATTNAVNALQAIMSPGAPAKPDSEPEATAPLMRLIDLTTLQNDLLKAITHLLTTGGGPPRIPTPPPRGGGGFEAALHKYFGKDTSQNVDPQRGLGRYAGKKLGQAYRKSRMTSFGKGGAKIARGAARSLGGGKKTIEKAGAAGAVIGKVIGAVTSLVETFIKANSAVGKWTDEAMATAAKLSQVSGGMAEVTANRDIDQLYRDMERGDKTSGSASRLQEAESGRKNEENKINIALDNATNNIMTLLNQLVTPILSAINVGIEGIKGIPLIGRAIKKFLESEEDDEGGIHVVGDAARVEARRLEAAGARLMAAAVLAGGSVFAAARRGVPPVPGAAPRGELP